MTVMFAASWCVVVANGCSATGTKVTPGTGGGATGGAAASTGSGDHTTSTSTGIGAATIVHQLRRGRRLRRRGRGDHQPLLAPSAARSSCATPRTSACDDNCNGLVDETCTCIPGSVHWCFAGDPVYHNTPGCYDGIETCSELGIWGPCIGGVQAVPPDNCFLNDTSACHAISALPYATVDLKTGTGHLQRQRRARERDVPGAVPRRRRASAPP